MVLVNCTVQVGHITLLYNYVIRTGKHLAKCTRKAGLIVISKKLIKKKLAFIRRLASDVTVVTSRFEAKFA